MYALEKHKEGKWQRCAVCARRKPLDRVVKGLSETENWRVVFVPETLAEREAIAATGLPLTERKSREP